MNRRLIGAALLASPWIFAQTKKPYQSQAASTFGFSVKDGAETIDIVNVSYQVLANTPGRPRQELLLMRRTVKTREVLGDIGMQGSTTVEAWPLGVDLKQKPVYALTVEGVDPAVVRGEVLVVSRGLEEVDWWTVYKLGSGVKLFDTYVPLVDFSISRSELTLRYAGLQVPEDDEKDSRLRAANVAFVVTYASAERVIREALVTCDDPKRAVLMRSLADSTRAVAYAGGSLRASVSQNYPSAPGTVSITIPVVKDDLDFVKATLPAGVHVAAFKR